MGAEQTWFYCNRFLHRIERVTVVESSDSYVVLKDRKTTGRFNRVMKWGSFHPTYDEAAKAWLDVLGREVSDARACLKASESKLAKANAWIEDHRTKVGLVS